MEAGYQQAGSPAPEGHTYIAASYIKFVEASGARAVPILEGSTRAEVEALFPRLNAVVFPGGNVRLTEPNNPFMETLTHLYLLAEAANERGLAWHGPRRPTTRGNGC